MVLIFLSGAPISAATKLYVNNILNTLFLPHGSRNPYRFAYAGAHINVDPHSIPHLESKKEDALLVFVDRYAVQGYRFHPLRRGRLVNAYREGDRLFCETELREYVSIPQFEQWIQENAHNKNCPHLVDNNPENPDDGYYVIHTSAKWRTLPIVASDDQVWTQHVDSLAACQRFQDPADHRFYFFRANIPRRRGGGKPLKARGGRFKIPANSRFELRISYRWPFQTPVPNAVFKINRSESLRGGANKVQVANPVDATVINFKTARVPEEDEMRIELEGDPDQNLFRPDAPVLFAIGFSKRQIICGIAGPVAFAVGSALTAAKDSCFWTKFLGEILKLIGLGLLFVAFGRKVT